MIKPVEIAAAYELVAEQIRRSIYLGKYMPGARLPSERLLTQQLGVSRTTLREAIRILEAQGLVESRRGAAGGLTVLTPQEQPGLLKQRLRDHVDTFEEIVEFRLAIECAASRLAAVRRTDEDLARLERTLDDLRFSENLPQFRAADNAFHLAIADVARNSMLREAIEDARIAMFTFIDVLFYSEVMRLAQHNDHSQILLAIKTADAHEASEAMAAHIARTQHEIHLILDSEEKQR